MDISLPDLESAARDIVRRQMSDGDLESLTKGNVRKKIEQRFSLGPGALSVKEYKQPLNLAIETAVHEFEEEMANADNISAEEPEARVKIQKVTKAPRKTKTNKADLPKPQPAKKRGEGSREYKSAAYIITSDMEDEAEPGIAPSGSKRVSTHNISNEEDDTNCEPPPQKRRKVGYINGSGSLEANIDVSKVVKDNNNDLEMSTLINEAPTRKGKRKAQTKTQDKTTKSSTEQKGRNLSQEPSKDEATIKRLKSFVTACGMRRPWVKLLEGCDTPSQQIKKLKEILAELGMSGRMSLDQAKKIKAKRELAKELEEVQSFAQPILGRSSRGKNKLKPEEESEPDGGESEEDMMPTKRNRRSALLSITAFLGDQSDDD